MGAATAMATATAAAANLVETSLSDAVTTALRAAFATTVTRWAFKPERDLEDSLAGSGIATLREAMATIVCA